MLGVFKPAAAFARRMLRDALRQYLPNPVHQRIEGALEVSGRVAPFTARGPVALRLMLAPRLRILCSPGRPSHWQVLYKVCALNGYAIVTDPDGPYDVAVHFTGGGVCTLPREALVLNRNCTDISKVHVAAVFERVFGYGLAVDPIRFQGQMVEKSDANYTHDGRILEGPIAPEEIRTGYVYQRLVGNIENGEAVDLRTPLYGGEIPLVYVKRRSPVDRFHNRRSSVKMWQAEDVFTPEERTNLKRFAREMGLDYGESDVLRDAEDGKIYVVDVANTPSGPPGSLATTDASVAIHVLADAFAKLVASTRTKVKGSVE